MQTAERLYMSGYLSYPRTESTAYPQGFDLQGTVRQMASHPTFGQYANDLLKDLKKPKGGHDAGDHPPITPMAPATERELDGGNAWRIYEMVVRHFLASVSSDCKYTKRKVELRVGGEVFHASGTKVTHHGFCAVQPHRLPAEEAFPPVSEGEKVQLKQVHLRQGHTSPPATMTESELLQKMEHHGIGTDASMPTHVRGGS